MPILFSEEEGYPREGRDRGRYWAVRKLRVAWADRGALAEALIGFPRQVYPYAPDTLARVDSVEGEPAPGQLTADTSVTDHTGGTPALYDEALLTVRYGTPRIGEGQPHPDPAYENDPQEEISETLEPFVETIALDHKRFVWSDGTPLSPEETPYTTVRRSKYVLTRYNQLMVPAAALTLPGKINVAAVQPVLLTGLVFPAMTLMLESPLLSISSQLDGSLGLDITYRFLYREETWRKYWRPEGGVVPLAGGGEGGSFQEVYFKPGPGIAPNQKYLIPETGDMSVILASGM